MRIAAVCLVPLALVTGCDLFPTVIDVPIPLDSPPADLDVGGPVNEGVASSCTDPASASCAGIAALCQAETGAPCDPVNLPAQFPKEIDLNNDGTNEQAEDALPDAVKEAAKIQIAIPVDLGDALKDANVDSPDQVTEITFEEVNLDWSENTITFDAPVLDVYVGPAVEAEEALDAAALIANSDFKRIGTIGIDNDDANPGFDVGQVAETAGEVPLTFVDGGNDEFAKALTSFKFTLVIAAPDDQELKLKELAGDATKVKRPDGAAKVGIKSTLLYKVDLAKAAGVSDEE